jgi:hypothetical protein
VVLARPPADAVRQRGDLICRARRRALVFIVPRVGDFLGNAAERVGAAIKLTRALQRRPAGVPACRRVQQREAPSWSTAWRGWVRLWGRRGSPRWGVGWTEVDPGRARIDGAARGCAQVKGVRSSPASSPRPPPRRRPSGGSGLGRARARRLIAASGRRLAWGAQILQGAGRLAVLWGGSSALLAARDAAESSPRFTSLAPTARRQLAGSWQLSSVGVSALRTTSSPGAGPDQGADPEQAFDARWARRQSARVADRAAFARGQ